MSAATIVDGGDTTMPNDNLDEVTAISEAMLRWLEDVFAGSSTANHQP